MQREESRGEGRKGKKAPRIEETPSFTPFGGGERQILPPSTVDTADNSEESSENPPQIVVKKPSKGFTGVGGEPRQK
ncbi:hypothetical protein AKJ66_01525 [candidate division MSBL1 archaeon SCGC-AAA259E22]|uniref:Uncharacterized protein n=1 Tax=candidate division MSBL1 archaeon SCGC-AAA259E22 TaxID=1698265 RepID=A0A133UHG0_9EURY|nr:hypothetical protein AKJ66_01525 [candidate division MSBL1 archaeon SCGC-AAA259E22]